MVPLNGELFAEFDPAGRSDGWNNRRLKFNKTRSILSRFGSVVLASPKLESAKTDTVEFDELTLGQGTPGIFREE